MILSIHRNKWKLPIILFSIFSIILVYKKIITWDFVSNLRIDNLFQPPSPNYDPLSEEINLLVSINNKYEVHSMSNLIKSILHSSQNTVLVRYNSTKTDFDFIRLRSTTMINFHVLSHDPNILMICRTLLDSWEFHIDLNVRFITISDKMSRATLGNLRKMLNPIKDNFSLPKNQLLWLNVKSIVLSDIRFTWMKLLQLMEENEHQTAVNFEACTTNIETSCKEILFLFMNDLYEFLQPKNFSVELLPNYFYSSLTDLEDIYSDNQEVLAIIWRYTGVTHESERVYQLIDMVQLLLASPPQLPAPPLGEDCGDCDADLETCHEYSRVAWAKRRTHLFFAGRWPGSNRMADPFEVSLMTILTADRLDRFKLILSNWAGPVVAVLYLSDWEADSILDRLKMDSVLSDFSRITYHVVYKRHQLNPINYLRNVAINSSSTPFLLYVDVDLVPNPQLYTNIKKYLESEYAKDELLVIPAFQSFTSMTDNFPKSKNDLLELINDDSIIGYRMKEKWNFGHKTTDFKKWNVANDPYEVEYEEYFEPYVVIASNVSIRYHQQLLERMFDKIAYIKNLHMAGFRFIVSPENYLVHLAHEVSASRKSYYSNKILQKCGTSLYKSISEDFEKQYGQSRP